MASARAGGGEAPSRVAQTAAPSFRTMTSGKPGCRTAAVRDAQKSFSSDKEERMEEIRVALTVAIATLAARRSVSRIRAATRSLAAAR